MRVPGRAFNAALKAGLLGLVCASSLAAQVNGTSFEPAAGAAPQLQLQVLGTQGALKLNRLGQAADARGRALAVTRLDLLLSSFSLQKADGSWTTPDARWHAFFRAEQPTAQQPLPKLPTGDYQALRFAVGVDKAANHADPNRLGPDDPLHPVVNGMHWGWTGGYVFMALEGHWQFDQAPAGSTGGFSYHLAGDDNLVTVTLPGPLHVQPGTRLRLQLDARRLLGAVDIRKDGDTTHSRRQDPVVLALKQVLPAAFKLSAAQPELARAGRPGGVHAAAPAAGQSQPYAMNVGTHMPTMTLPEDNTPTVAGVALGKALFEDPRLSSDGSLRCASCHSSSHAGADPGQAVSRGVRGQPGQRNTMPLFNLAWAPAFTWDGKAPSLRRQALAPVQAAHEMAETLPRVVAKLAADRSMAQQFQSAFGGPVSAARVGLALEQYLLTLVSQDAKFDRVMKGSESFTAPEKRGFELFLTEHEPGQGLRGGDCFHCHGGALFTNQKFINIGLPEAAAAPAADPGKARKAADTGKAQQATDFGRERVTQDPADRGKFRTPSLRNVAVTAPYMHDGRFKTLEEVVDHYDHGVQRNANLDPNLAKHPATGMQLSAEDKAALVAFLRTLTDRAFVEPTPASAPTKTAAASSR